MLSIFSLLKCLFKSFACFLLWLSYYWVLRVFFVFWIWVIYEIHHMLCKYFPPSYGLSFRSLSNVFWRAKVFDFVEVQVIDLFMDCAFIHLFFFLDCAFNVISSNLWLNQGHKDFPHVFSSRSFVLSFSHWIAFAPLSKISFPYMYNFIGDSLVCLLINLSIFVPRPCCFDDCSLIMS